jgi:hypothetical protein
LCEYLLDSGASRNLNVWGPVLGGKYNADI